MKRRFTASCPSGTDWVVVRIDDERFRCLDPDKGYCLSADDAEDLARLLARAIKTAKGRGQRGGTKVS